MFPPRVRQGRKVAPGEPTLAARSGPVGDRPVRRAVILFSGLPLQQVLAGAASNASRRVVFVPAVWYFFSGSRLQRTRREKASEPTKSRICCLNKGRSL